MYEQAAMQQAQAGISLPNRPIGGAMQGATQQPRITAAAERLESNVDRLEKILLIGHQHLERVAGSVPTPGKQEYGNGNGTDAPPPSQLARIETTIERLSVLVNSHAAHMVERLGQI